MLYTRDNHIFIIYTAVVIQLLNHEQKLKDTIVSESDLCFSSKSPLIYQISSSNKMTTLTESFVPHTKYIWNKDGTESDND